jgi:hypothetical protein
MTTFQRLLIFALISILFTVVIWWVVGILSIPDAAAHGAAITRGLYR